MNGRKCIYRVINTSFDTLIRFAVPFVSVGVLDGSVRSAYVRDDFSVCHMCVSVCVCLSVCVYQSVCVFVFYSVNWTSGAELTIFSILSLGLGIFSVDFV